MQRKPLASNVRLALIFTFVLALLIYAAIFLTEWAFTVEKDEHRILDGTLLGVLIAQPGQWVGVILAFYFASKLADGEKPG